MITESLLAKIIGSISGTFLSLVFSTPRTRADFLRRTICALLVGPIASPVIIWWTKLPVDFDTQVAITAFASYVSWVILGYLSKATPKFLETKDPLNPEEQK